MYLVGSDLNPVLLGLEDKTRLKCPGLIFQADPFVLRVQTYFLSKIAHLLDKLLDDLLDDLLDAGVVHFLHTKSGACLMAGNVFDGNN